MFMWDKSFAHQYAIEQNVRLKDLYDTNVNKVYKKTLNTVSTEIKDFCIRKILIGSELPYKFTVDSKGINSVHDLKPYLEDFGIVANLCFYKQMSDLIEVTVTQFTK